MDSEFNNQEIVTLMTLGSRPEELTLGYLRNQKLIESVNDIKSVIVDWDFTATLLAYIVDLLIFKHHPIRMFLFPVTTRPARGPCRVQAVEVKAEANAILVLIAAETEYGCAVE